MKAENSSMKLWDYWWKILPNVNKVNLLFESFNNWRHNGCYAYFWWGDSKPNTNITRDPFNIRLITFQQTNTGEQHTHYQWYPNSKQILGGCNSTTSSSRTYYLWILFGIQAAGKDPNGKIDISFSSPSPRQQYFPRETFKHHEKRLLLPTTRLIQVSLSQGNS